MPENKEATGNGMLTRAVPLNVSTANRDTLSVEGVIASETPAVMFDRRYGEVDEVLLMEGVILPKKMPLLDAHQRNSVANVIGGSSNFRVEGSKIVSFNEFYPDDFGEKAFGKVERGFITDFSVGYNVNVASYISPGETKEINGRSWTASENRTMKIGKVWTIKENSLVPIGADVTAKVRAEDDIDKTIVEDVTPPEEITDERKETMPDEKKETMPDEKKEVEKVETPAIDVDAIRAEGAKFERERVAGIRDAALDLDIKPEVVEDAIRDGKSVEESRKDILAALRVSKDEPVGPAIHSHEDDSGKREVVDAALMLRGNMETEAVTEFGEKAVDAARKIGNITMRGLMQWGLRAAGEQTSEFVTTDDLIRKSFHLSQRGTGAFSSMSLPYMLGNIAKKSMLRAYGDLSSSWEKWVDEISTNDFKSTTLFRPTIGSGFEQIGPGGEIKHGTVVEEHEEGRLHSWGELLAITREQILNDDASAFTRTPAGLGRDARNKLSNRVYTVLLANGTLEDGYDLCGTDHGNYLSGTVSGLTSALAVDAISASLVKFLQMTDQAGNPIDVSPTMILVPPEKEAVAAAVFNSEFVTGPNTSNSPNANVNRGRYEVVTETRLSTTSYTGHSTTAWYMLAPKVAADSIAVMWLNNQKTPIIEQGAVDFNTLGIQYRAYHDFEAEMTGYRGIVKNAGA